MRIEDLPMETMMHRSLRALPIAIAAALFSAGTPAETIVHYREGQRVEAADVARLLGTRTRSIRLLDEPAAGTAAARPGLVAHTAEPPPAGLSLPVRFAFGSAEIQPAARGQLDALATGIKMLPSETDVTIEGHTDAIGSETYNLELSRERARSVRDYLMRRHGLNGSRLKTAGYGEGRPIDGRDPYAGENRRVEFRGS